MLAYRTSLLVHDSRPALGLTFFVSARPDGGFRLAIFGDNSFCSEYYLAFLLPGRFTGKCVNSANSYGVQQRATGYL